MLDRCETKCADCGYKDVSWAIINRGLLICDECCSIHRTLGRHISQLKSLTKGNWRTSQLNMVQTLNNNGINRLWEHSLSDSKCSKKKPKPTDPLHPNRAEFIRAKHVDLAYVLKCQNTDSPEDLNQQLHSIVRTDSLEASLRLLILGADPNYYHTEKGSRIITVAAYSGQMNQIELLISYGADPNVLDNHGNSIIQCAELYGFGDLEEKLIECIYEVTDSFCMFLCNRKPNHKTEHFFVPDASQCVVTPVLNAQFRARLQQLSNPLFEELVTDVYDEVDRRENEAIFESTCTLKDPTLVPFLPVNPELSTMRNQGRQKLARLNKTEFATLVWDILHECRRRHNAQELSKTKCTADANNVDEEPLYDSVASDDDYAIAEDLVDSNKDTKSTEQQHNNQSSCANVEEESSDLKSRLITSEVRISELVNQVVELQKKMDEMKKENVELRNTIQHRQKSPTEAVELVADVKPRPTSLYNIAQQYINSSNNNVERTTSPEPNEVLRRADQVTKCLQELSKTLRSIEYYGAFAPCVENIRTAVTELSAIFPQGCTEEVVRSGIRALNTNTIRLQAVCADVDATVDKIRNCAFNMAKANKQILTHFQC